MDIESGIERLLNPVDKYSSWIGAGFGALQTFPNISQVIQLISSGQVHFPNLQNFVNYVLASNNGVIPGTAAAIIGYIVKNATNNRLISRLGEITQKGATGWTVVWLAVLFAWSCTHSPLIGNPQGTPTNPGYLTVSQGSTLGSGTGGQQLAPYQSVYPTNPTAGTMYTTTSGARLVGN